MRGGVQMRVEAKIFAGQHLRRENDLPRVLREVLDDVKHSLHSGD